MIVISMSGIEKMQQKCLGVDVHIVCESQKVRECRAEDAAKRVFPFDSGAFHRDLLSKLIPSKMRLGDFQLEPDPSSPGKLISYFFGSNEAYAARRPIRREADDSSDFEIQSYADLINVRGNNSFDNRSATIEVQTENRLPFSEMVAAVILPSALEGSRVHKDRSADRLALITRGVASTHNPGPEAATLFDD